MEINSLPISLVNLEDPQDLALLCYPYRKQKDIITSWNTFCEHGIKYDFFFLMFSELHYLVFGFNQDFKCKNITCM